MCVCVKRLQENRREADEEALTSTTPSEAWSAAGAVELYSTQTSAVAATKHTSAGGEAALQLGELRAGLAGEFGLGTDRFPRA